MNEKKINIVKSPEFRGFQRNDTILKRKFYEFLLPAVLSVAATSMNEFLDSIVVAQTLGSDAMSMVNMASPVIFIFSLVYVLLGTGGSTLFASLKGQMNEKRASEVLTATMVIAMMASLVIILLGMAFLTPVIFFLSSGMEMSSQFTEYTRILFFSGPFIILLEVCLMFFPAVGMPKITTKINIIANVVNILCDYLYTAVFHMDLPGAALATLTGYAVGMAVLLFDLFSKKCSLPFVKVSRSIFSCLGEVVGKGAATSLGQLGYLFKISFSNHIAISFAGAAGIAVFSACFQTLSIISVFLSGLLNSMIPIVAILYGQKDYHGIQLLMKNILKMELLVTAAISVLFEIFPTAVLGLYDVKTSEELAVGIPALRIFTCMYLFRQTVLLFTYYLQTVGKKVYAITLSVADVVGIILIALIICPSTGITGLWLSYPVCAALILLGIVIANYCLVKKAKGTLTGSLLLPKTTVEAAELDFSLKVQPGEVSQHTENLIKFFTVHEIDRKRATIAAIACEELCAYTQEKENEETEMDVLIYIMNGEIRMNFRSIGSPFSPMALPDEEQFSSIAILNKLAKEIHYDYIIGMNQTLIVL